jgi:hypothetical protein
VYESTGCLLGELVLGEERIERQLQLLGRAPIPSHTLPRQPSPAEDAVPAGRAAEPPEQLADGDRLGGELAVADELVEHEEA